MAGQTPIPGDICTPEQWRVHGFGVPPEWRERISARAFWITGAGTGFGRAAATALALVGARVVLTGRRLSKLEETASEIAGLADLHRDTARIGTARIDLLPLDLRVPSQVEAATGVLRQAGVTGLVHCAALPPSPSAAPLLLTDGLPTLLAANVEAAWRAGSAAVRMAAGQGSVRVVYFSSAAGWHFTPGVGAYNVSKAALNSLGGSLAEEAAAFHGQCDVQINVLDPGEARSEMNDTSTRSPYAAVPMTLALLGQPCGGPNGRFFHVGGRHLAFGARPAWPTSLFEQAETPAAPLPPVEPPRTTGLPAATITQSSKLEQLDASGVLGAEQPGWHAARQAPYPQWVAIAFEQLQTISRVSLLPQDTHASRAPGRLDVQTSQDGEAWTTVLAIADACQGCENSWRSFALDKPVTTRWLRLLIHANCGDPDHLTLRGVRLE